MIATAALLLLTAPTAPTAQPARRAQPLQPLGELISSEDYPLDAIIRNAGGRTRFLLAIDEEGMPFSCRILESAKEPSLDRVTCDIFMTRARFRPALDAKGHPVPDTYANVVDWRLPEEVTGALAFEPSRRVVTVYPAGDRVSHCEMRQNDFAWPRLTRDQCLELAGRDLVDLTEYLKTPAPMTFVTMFVPHGQTAQPDEQDYGTLAFEVTAAIRIAPGGEIDHCQMVSFKPYFDRPNREKAPDVCDIFGQEFNFVAAKNPGEVRAGVATARYYIGHDPAGAKEPEPVR